MSGEPSSSDVHHDNYPSVGRTRQKGDSVALEAIRLIRHAVQSAIDHDGVHPETICKSVGLSKAHLKTWLASSVLCPQWDAKVSDWIKQTQGQALHAECNKRGRGRSGGRNASSTDAVPLVDAAALNKVIDDLLELENYIPWGAVASVWGSKRAAWARRARECTEVPAVARHIVVLEESMVAHAFDPEWRISVRDDWRSELLMETCPTKLAALVRQMEEWMRWKHFGQREIIVEALKTLLKSPVGSKLRRLEAGRDSESDADTPALTVKQIQLKASNFNYEDLQDLARDCCLLADGLPDPSKAHRAILKALQMPESDLHVSHDDDRADAGDEEDDDVYADEGGEQEENGEGGEENDGDGDIADEGGELDFEISDLAALEEEEEEEEEDLLSNDGSSLEPSIVFEQASVCSNTKISSNGFLPEELALSEEARLAGAKRERVVDKEAKYEYFKRQQRLHPEYAGIYADEFNAMQQNMRRFQELLVFHGAATPERIAGVVHLFPDTTLRCLRQQLSEELGLMGGDDLLLRRATMIGSHAGEGTPNRASCPLPPTQNHKLVYPFFAHLNHVLVVDRAQSSPPKARLEVPAPNRPQERLLSADISRGHERQLVPIYNGADDEPAPEFTYVTQCVVGEALRLLLGGPIRESWMCPVEAVADRANAERALVSMDNLDYDERGRLRHAAHTVDSIYECSLLSNCQPGCPNRLVQLGPRFRLEVFRCAATDGRYAKGWGVRSPDMIPKGSFVCEYIGEYISDDEAESRGTRYDNQRMSRLMDVVGDGRLAVRMCIDATNFSNLGRFLNHSCEPNCFKQRVFCDHHVRLPRVAFFALTDIAPLDELCYDYGYADVPGKTMPCLCGARTCTKLLY